MPFAQFGLGGETARHRDVVPGVGLAADVRLLHAGEELVLEVGLMALVDEPVSPVSLRQDSMISVRPSHIAAGPGRTCPLMGDSLAQPPAWPDPPRRAHCFPCRSRSRAPPYHSRRPNRSTRHRRPWVPVLFFALLASRGWLVILSR